MEAVLIGLSVGAMCSPLLYTRKKIRKVINMIASIGTSLVASLAVSAAATSSPPPPQGPRGAGEY
jgi:hypothetical protein